MSHAAGAELSAGVHFFAPHTAAILLIRPIRRANSFFIYGLGSQIREDIGRRRERTEQSIVAAER